MSKAFVVFCMEIRRFFQSGKQALTTFLLGPVVVFALLFVIGAATKTKACIEIYGGKGIEAALSNSSAFGSELLFLDGVPDTHKTTIKKNLVQIHPEAEKVTIYYHSPMITDLSILGKAKTVAMHIAALQMGQNDYTHFQNSIAALRMIDISTQEDVIQGAVIPFISMIFIVVMMLTNMHLCQMAIDMIAGERERGTFDMFRLSGTRISLILAGKYAFVVLIGVLLLVFGACSMLMGISLFQPTLLQAVNVPRERILALLFFTLICFISVSILVSALYFALSASFSKAKQASAYAFGVQIILSLLSYASNLWDADVHKYLPISNIWAVIHQVLIGKDGFSYVAVGLILSAAGALTALSYASAMLTLEAKQ